MQSLLLPLLSVSLTKKISVLSAFFPKCHQATHQSAATVNINHTCRCSEIAMFSCSMGPKSWANCCEISATPSSSSSSSLSSALSELLCRGLVCPLVGEPVPRTLYRHPRPDTCNYGMPKWSHIWIEDTFHDITMYHTTIATP